MDAADARPPSPIAPSGPHRDRRGAFARFLAVGPVGTALGALQYECLWRLHPDAPFRSGSTWLLSSLLGVAWIHAIHCRFTFRARRGAWRATLGRAYVGYAATIALGAALVAALADGAGWHRSPAWALATAVTSAVNFLFLRRLVPGPEPSR
jgi:putative flippase GtrA